MRWPNARENPGPPAPSRYCLLTCYCGRCDHYEPLPPLRRPTHHHRRTDGAWNTREDQTWIDRL